MSDPIDRLKARWAAEGIAIRPGNSPERLDAFEARCRVALPPLVREYFASVDGSGEDMDGEHFRFWPLDEVRSLAEYCGFEPVVADRSERWFVFVDHLLNSFHLVVRLTSDPAGAAPVALADGLDLHNATAPSFEIFLGLYLADKKNLYRQGGPVED